MNLLNLIWLVPAYLWLGVVAAGTLYTFAWLIHRYPGLILAYVAVVAILVLLFR